MKTEMLGAVASGAIRVADDRARSASFPAFPEIFRRSAGGGLHFLLVKAQR